MNRFAKIAILTATAALTAGVLAPTQASADGVVIGNVCSEVGDTAGASYNVKLCDVTDVDQFRVNLPKNGNAATAVLAPSTTSSTTWRSTAA